MAIFEEQTRERVARDYPRHDTDNDSYLIRDRDERSRRTAAPAAAMASGSGVATIAGIAVAVLAILSLIGVIPRILLPIAGIVFGIAMVFESVGITGEHRKLGRWLAETSSERVEFGGGVGVEAAVGIAAVALGILALIGVASTTLMPILVLAGGAGLMIAVGTVYRLHDLQLSSLSASDFGRRLRHESMAGAAAVETLTGLAALVLGILALVSTVPAAGGYGLLAEIGMICLGVGVAIGGGALAGRSTMLYHRA